MKLNQVKINPKTLNIALLLLRSMFAILMVANHGFPKLQKILNGNFAFADPIGIGEPASLILAASAETLASIFLLLGLFTRLALIPLIVTMIVATFVQNAGEGLGEIELGLLYLTGFIALILTGPGNYSVDARMK